MKIYCNRSIHNFDRYIGKDLWIKMETPWANGQWIPEYMKFVDKSEVYPNMYTVAKCPDFETWNVDIGGYLSEGDLQDCMTDIHSIVISRCKAPDEFEAYTTAELLSMWENSDAFVSYEDMDI